MKSLTSSFLLQKKEKRKKRKRGEDREDKNILMWFVK